MALNQSIRHLSRQFPKLTRSFRTGIPVRGGGGADHHEHEGYVNTNL